MCRIKLQKCIRTMTFEEATTKFAGVIGIGGVRVVFWLVIGIGGIRVVYWLVIGIGGTRVVYWLIIGIGSGGIGHWFNWCRNCRPLFPCIRHSLHLVGSQGEGRGERAENKECLQGGAHLASDVLMC